MRGSLPAAGSARAEPEALEYATPEMQAYLAPAGDGAGRRMSGDDRGRPMSKARLSLAAASLLAWQAHANSDKIEARRHPAYADEGDAKAACGDDPVVWADSHSGFFYPKFHSDLARRQRRLHLLRPGQKGRLLEPDARGRRES